MDIFIWVLPCTWLSSHLTYQHFGKENLLLKSLGFWVETESSVIWRFRRFTIFLGGQRITNYWGGISNNDLQTFFRQRGTATDDKLFENISSNYQPRCRRRWIQFTKCLLNLYFVYKDGEQIPSNGNKVEFFGKERPIPMPIKNNEICYRNL